MVPFLPQKLTIKGGPGDEASNGEASNGSNSMIKGGGVKCQCRSIVWTCPLTPQPKLVPYEVHLCPCPLGLNACPPWTQQYLTSNVDSKGRSTPLFRAAAIVLVSRFHSSTKFYFLNNCRASNSSKVSPTENCAAMLPTTAGTGLILASIPVPVLGEFNIPVPVPVLHCPQIPCRCRCSRHSD